jgi:hypothetical protein
MEAEWKKKAVKALKDVQESNMYVQHIFSDDTCFKFAVSASFYSSSSTLSDFDKRDADPSDERFCSR